MTQTVLISNPSLHFCPVLKRSISMQENLPKMIVYILKSSGLLVINGGLLYLLGPLHVLAIEYIGDKEYLEVNSNLFIYSSFILQIVFPVIGFFLYHLLFNRKYKISISGKEYIHFISIVLLLGLVTYPFMGLDAEIVIPIYCIVYMILMTYSLKFKYYNRSDKK